MTSKQQIEKLLTALRDPKTLLTVVALVGALPAMLLFARAYVPAAQLAAASAGELAIMREAHDRLSSSPMPDPFRQEELIAWLAKVPTEENHASLLSLLLDIEAQSGARIERFEVGEEEAPKDLIDLLAEAQSQAAAGGAGGEQAKARQPTEAPAAEALQAELVTIEVAGTFSQVKTYWERLAGMERVAVIQQWSLSAAETEKSDPTEATVRLQLRFRLYTAPSFKDLAPADASSPSGREPSRLDPTMTDEQFYDRLTGTPGKE
ncbi:hypothetical protein [Paenibacillus sp.]|uniref:hypothetical protein n=1 Tax=Paenibacillus sp. TaxID=58172 RepID=UPI002D32EBD9|nr:hypothetical protein [Paenibacillus sp.]HZG56048.1 hypothetical protein [Paenibacillus sp.]